MSTTCPDRRRGFAIVSAIFILVVLATLAGFIVSLTGSQNTGFVQDIQGARAYQVARAGVEWGVSRWLNASDCTGNGAPTSLDGFSLTVSVSHLNSTTPAFCTITATASTGGAAGNAGFVERQLRVVVEGN